jgi:hypothetical protein
MAAASWARFVGCSGADSRGVLSRPWHKQAFPLPVEPAGNAESRSERLGPTTIRLDQELEDGRLTRSLRCE